MESLNIMHMIKVVYSWNLDHATT